MTTKVTRNMLNTSIDDNGNATALTISADEFIGINCTDPQTPLEIDTSTANYRIQFTHTSGQNQIKSIDSNHSTMRALFYDAAQHVNQVSGTTAQTIDSSGYVTKPSQPYIRCSGSTAGAVTSHGSVTDFSYWTNQVQRGITRSGATFTVPTAGAYLITYNLYFWIDNSGQGVSHSIYFSKNSTTVQEVQWESQDSSFFYSDNTKGSSLVLDMAAGDTFKFAVNADIYGGTTHCTMSAYLLG